MEENIDKMENSVPENAPQTGERGSMNRHAQIWGLYLGIAKSILLLIMVFTLMVKPSFWFTVFEFVVIIGLIVFCIRTYKRAGSTPLMSYSKVFKLGVLQSLYASLVVLFMAALTFYIIKPDYMDAVLEQSLEILAETMPEDSITYETAAKTVERMTTPFVYTISMVFNMFVSGLIITLIVGIFMKEKER